MLGGLDGRLVVVGLCCLDVVEVMLDGLQRV